MSPVGALVRLHFLAHRLLEVFVGDLAVAVGVEEVEKFLKFFLVRSHAPVSQVELEVFRNDAAMLANVHLHKRLSHRLPLLEDLRNNFLDKILVVGLLARDKVFLRELHLKAFRVGVELGVHGLRVMTEEEAFRFVDSRAEPLREVREVDAPFTIAILDLEKLEQIVVLHGLIRAVVVHEVLYGDEAVEVFVQEEERLSHFLEVFCYFPLNFPVQILDAV